MVGHDTIAAIATPFGVGGIGIVKVSGPDGLAVASRLFRGKSSHPLGESHRLRLGHIVDPADGCALDEVLVGYMAAPHTYTGEDVVEINCHGGALVLEKVLELVVRQGVRLAEPGEFTRRAFLNGRIDLAQAEAVLDIVEAKTEAGLRVASNQLRGKLGTQVEAFREELVTILSSIEASIDFPEEEIENIDGPHTAQHIEDVLPAIKLVLHTYEEGRLYREGISAVIVGKPNVGKSSLLNRLVGSERAIVTEIAGTTRDLIEGVINVHGVPVQLFDTAGLREVRGVVEERGVSMAREKLSQADVVLLVLDASEPLDELDREVLEGSQSKARLVVLNKSDLPQRISPSALEEGFGISGPIPVSALYGDGMGALKNRIHRAIIGCALKPAGEIMISNVRHKVALEDAQGALEATLEGIRGGASPELVAFDLRCALEHLDRIVGGHVSEEVLEKIFSRFCIGK